MPKVIKLNKDIKQYAIRILSDDHRHKKYLNIGKGYVTYSDHPVVYNSAKVANTSASNNLKPGEYEIVEFVLRLEEVKNKKSAIDEFVKNFIRTRDIEDQEIFDELFRKSKTLKPLSSNCSFHIYSEVYEIDGKTYEFSWDYNCSSNSKPISISMRM